MSSTRGNSRRPARGVVVTLLGGGKALGVLLKTLAAEEFGPNRFFEPWQGSGPYTDGAEQVLKRKEHWQSTYLSK